MQSLKAWFLRITSFIFVLVLFAIFQNFDGSSSNSTTIAPLAGLNYYVSPDGTGTACSVTNPCLLATAQSLIRAQTTSMTADINVYLKGGLYQLTTPWKLSSQDSGANGFYVNYLNQDSNSPVISGGLLVQDWQLVDATKNLYKASVPSGFDSRQLYVNGIRSYRDQVLLSSTNALPTGAVGSTLGYDFNLPGMATWKNLGSAEVVSKIDWREYRCPIANVVPGTAHLNLSTGAAFTNNANTGYVNSNLSAILSGDFDGDGKSDLFEVGFDSYGGKHNYVYLSTGQGFEAPEDWLPLQVNENHIYVGDFNGDGKSDLLFSYMDGAGVFHNAVAISDGTKFLPPVDWLLNQGQGTQINVGDFNGDGKTDVIFFYMDASNVWHDSVALSNGNAFSRGTDWLLNQGQGTQINIGDFNGDGKADLVFSYADSSNVWHNGVALSTGSYFAHNVDWSINQGQGTTIYVGDYNGDGKTDMMFVYYDSSQVWHNNVAFSSGHSFSSSSNWVVPQSSTSHYTLGDFDGNKSTDLFLTTDQSIRPQNPCWTNSTQNGRPMQDNLSWIENSYEILNSTGHWYLDRSANAIYYIPRPTENMATAKVVVSNLEQLVIGQSVSHIRFSNLVFAYGAWLEPDTSVGYSEIQAGAHSNANHAPEMTLGHIQFFASKSISFQGNQFLHMGGAALRFGSGSQNIQIVGNTFSDLSSSGIVFGDLADQTQTNTALQNSNLTVTNNYFVQNSREFEGAVPIFITYVNQATISQNEVDGAPYTGISAGWGWGTADGYSQDVVISQNWIHDVMQSLSDGGGVYTLGASPQSSVSQNLIENIGPQANANCHTNSSFYVGIYHDNGSQHFTDNSNVIRNSCKYWLLLQGQWANPLADSSNNTVTGNFVDVDRAYCTKVDGTSANCNFDGNTVAGQSFGTPLSTQGQSYAAGAGINSSFSFAKQVKTGSFY